MCNVSLMKKLLARLTNMTKDEASSLADMSEFKTLIDAISDADSIRAYYTNVLSSETVAYRELIPGKKLDLQIMIDGECATCTVFSFFKENVDTAFSLLRDRSALFKIFLEIFNSDF